MDSRESSPEVYNERTEQAHVLTKYSLNTYMPQARDFVGSGQTDMTTTLLCLQGLHGHLGKTGQVNNGSRQSKRIPGRSGSLSQGVEARGGFLGPVW